MNRRALIISAPGVPGTDGYLLGAEKDVDLYRDFLKSDLGGAWNDSEIIILKSPVELAIRAELVAMQKQDYGFIVFSGHGYHDANNDCTKLCLNNNKEISETLLRNSAPKQTTVLDCCRIVETGTLLESFAKAMKGDISLNRQKCRNLFDERVGSCSTAQVVLYACQLNQTAGDIATRGGRYSYSLVKSAEEWKQQNSVGSGFGQQLQNKVLSVVGAHDLAAKKVDSDTKGGQQPTIEKPRLQTFFPFAVIA